MQCVSSLNSRIRTLFLLVEENDLTYSEANLRFTFVLIFQVWAIQYKRDKSDLKLEGSKFS